MATSNSSRQIAVTFGAIFVFLGAAALGYYLGWSNTWAQFRQLPLIGADKLEPQLVVVVKEIPPGGEIAFENIEERKVKVDRLAGDSLGFAAECMGRKVKWGLKKGDYVSLHDLLPRQEKDQ